jgi:hypothetical protein
MIENEIPESTGIQDETQKNSWVIQALVGGWCAEVLSEDLVGGGREGEGS